MEDTGLMQSTQLIWLHTSGHPLAPDNGTDNIPRFPRDHLVLKLHKMQCSLNEYHREHDASSFIPHEIVCNVVSASCGQTAEVPNPDPRDGYSPPPPQQVSPEFIDNAIKENLGKLFGLQEAGGRRGGHLLGEVILTRTQLCNMNNITCSCNFLLLHHI